MSSEGRLSCRDAGPRFPAAMQGRGFLPLKFFNRAGDRSYRPVKCAFV
jgi:hypothetical protein